MRRLKKILCVLTAIVLLLTSTPIVALCEEGISALTQPYSFSYEDESLTVEAKVSRDAVFTADEMEIKNDEVHLSADTDVGEVFSELNENYEGELIAVDLSYRDENDAEVQQTEGSTSLTLTIPIEDENAVISDVEVFRYTETEGDEGVIERIEDAAFDIEEQTVTFDAGILGVYALRYTVDYRYGDQEYHMIGGSSMLLSELFAQLNIKLSAADAVSIEFTDETLLSFTRTEDESDWIIDSLAPFDTEERMTVTFADGYALNILVTDEGESGYAESTNLEDFMTGWKITIGDTVFSDDTVTEDTVIEYKPGMQYSFELNFSERSDLGFATPETDAPEMYFQLPDCFILPPDYQMALNVKLGSKGVLANNIVSVVNQIGTDNELHNFLKLRWNWEDTLHWNYFRDSSQAKINIVVNGTFADISPNVLAINGKEVAVRREDLHNAVVNKQGVYNPQTGIIDYTVTVSSQGTTNDITLTDTLGIALTYLTDEPHNGGIVYNAAESTNSQNTVPQITQKTGNTFNVIIPAMVDGDSLVFNYSAQVNYDMIAISGSPSFEETGNTAEVFGDSYTLDNKAIYHEMNIEFSDLVKNVTGKRRDSIAGNLIYIINWEIETNKRAQYPLADTDITDTISPIVQDISKYYGSGVTVECYTVDGTRADYRELSWEELGVDLANDVSWTYHIPETDPMYRYVLKYQTVVYMDAATETIVAENTAEGKGGIDSDRAVLPPPGKGGIDVTKEAVYQDSTHVTWEITLTVAGTAFDYPQLALYEHSGSQSNGTTWANDRLPYKWVPYPYDDGTWDPNNSRTKLFKETLQKVEVIGLENGETFKVTYSDTVRNNNGARVEDLKDYFPAEGSGVLETDFTGWYNSGDRCQIWFYKDYSRTQGGINKPEGEDPSRTIVVRLYTTFSEEWATRARDYMLYKANRDSAQYSHINWISAEAPDSSGKMTTRAKDTDKIMPMPPHVYKTVLEVSNADSTTATADNRKKFILDFDHPIIRSWNSTEYGTAYPNSVVYPYFRYQVLVSGLKYDEPLVIEDTFDTSLFEFVTAENFRGGDLIMTDGSRQWTHTYFCKVFGMNEYGWTPSSDAANFNGTETRHVIYGFGYKNNNYYHKAEDFGCTLEKTETGVRITINELFKRKDGSLYPFYGIDYHLVPKNLEALKKIEEMARANALAGGEPKATFTNTATSKGTTASAKVKIGITNDFMPIDKNSETYIDVMTNDGISRVKLNSSEDGGRKIWDTPDNISNDDIQRYVMKYRITLNKGGERLNDGDFITAEDQYSSNLSVDFTSINITTVPAEAVSQVSYDFSGNIGYFTIPDETQVNIEYEAVVINNQAGLVDVSNEVRMLQYSKKVDDTVDHGGAGGSSAMNPGIRVKKYGSGHMETGLNGAQFQLFEYNHTGYKSAPTPEEIANGWSSSNTSADWTPVVLPLPSPHDAIFTTKNTTVGSKNLGDGYALIELSQTSDGMTLQQGKTYGVREITTPVSTASNGDEIKYKNPHDETFFCYIFTICDENQVADYSNYVYMADDTMTVRNTPESIALHMKKQLEGNCTLTNEEKSHLTYQVFMKQKPAEDAAAVYMPIMTNGTDPDTGEEIDIIDPRFVGITYNQVAANNGVDITGMTVESGATVGEYLLVEYGNSTIMSGHPDWSWRGNYRWNDGGEGSFTNSTYTVYDEEGQNPQTVTGIAFTVTSQEVRDGENKTVVITNTYNRETLTLTANKRWTGPTGSAITWPSSKSVVFELGTLNDNGDYTALSPLTRITLDNVKDSSGEDTAGSAVFKNLPKFEVVSGATREIRYAVKEVAAVNGYEIKYPVQDAEYAAFGSATTVTIRNQMESTGISVSKVWDKGQIPAGASATFRLYSYTGFDPSTAVWVNNVNDIILNGVADEGAVSFGEVTPWQADFTGLPKTNSDGQTLRYIAKEIECSPANYEPVEDYAADGGTITNKPASVTFTVSKVWLGTPSNAWPSGTNITLCLSRRTREGVVDTAFSADYTVSASAVLSQDAIVDSYGESRQTGSIAGGTLTVSDLPKYDQSGNEWLYYVTETAINSSNGTDVSGSYTTIYRDKNNYIQSNMTYSGGGVTNMLSTRELTMSKTVSGNMGDKTKGFRFTVLLQNADSSPYSGTVQYKGTDQSGSSVTGELEFVSGTAEITLRHNETVTLPDLPGGLRFTITENEGDAAGYQTAYTVNGSTSMTGRAVSGTLANNPNVAFANSRQVLIPSGVSEGGIELVAAMPVLLLCVTFLQKRKRESD